MSPPGYHLNGFLATYGFEYLMYGNTLLLPMNKKVLNKRRKEVRTSENSSTSETYYGLEV